MSLNVETVFLHQGSQNVMGMMLIPTQFRIRMYVEGSESQVCVGFLDCLLYALDYGRRHITPLLAGHVVHLAKKAFCTYKGKISTRAAYGGRYLYIPG